MPNPTMTSLVQKLGPAFEEMEKASFIEKPALAQSLALEMATVMFEIAKKIDALEAAHAET